MPARLPDAKCAWVLGAGGALALMLTLMMAVPEPASASVPHAPVAAIWDVFPDVGELAQKVVKAIIDKFFGIPAGITTDILKYMVRSPNYADAGRFPELGDLRTYIASASWGLLTLTFTGAVLRYWAAGFTATSSGEAVASLGRSVAAVAGLIAYPQVFGYVVTICNMLSDGILNAPGVHHGLAVMFAATFALNNPGISAMAGVVAAVVMVGLVVTKVVLSVMLAALYVSAPLVIVMWPLGALAWLPTLWFKSVIVVCIWPVIWSIVFAVFAVVGASTFSMNGGIGQAFFNPWIAASGLLAAFKTPQAVARSAIGVQIVPHTGQAVQRALMFAFAASKMGGGGGGGGGGPAPVRSTSRVSASGRASASSHTTIVVPPRTDPR
jgi:hypothetical protein